MKACLKTFIKNPFLLTDSWWYARKIQNRVLTRSVNITFMLSKGTLFKISKLGKILAGFLIYVNFFFLLQFFSSSYNSYFSWQLTYWSVRTWMLFFHSIPDTGGQHVQNNHFQKSTILLVQYWRKKLNINCRIFTRFTWPFLSLSTLILFIHIELFLYF